MTLSRLETKAFLDKVCMEGLDYAVENYPPKGTGPQGKMERLLHNYGKAMAELKEHIEEVREAWGIEVI